MDSGLVDEFATFTWKLNSSSNTSLHWFGDPVPDAALITLAQQSTDTVVTPAEVTYTASFGDLVTLAETAEKLPDPEPATVEPAPAPGDDTPILIGTLTLTRAQVQEAIDLLTANKSNWVVVPLQKIGHPLAEHSWELANRENAYDPAIPTPKGRHALVQHLTKALTGSHLGPFALDANRYAIAPVPDPGDLMYWGVDAYRDYIGKVAAAIGNGKIVGRGASRLSPNKLVEWVHAWLRGDMKAVYDLEIDTGVMGSPHHPGAPGNPATHRIVWQPAIPGEIPAGIRIPGIWKSPEGSWTNAMVDNYLVRAKAKNPQYMSMSQRSRWVKAHLAGRKYDVDQISRKVHPHQGNFYRSHAPVLSPDMPPSQWDTWRNYVDDHVGVEVWHTLALETFAADHGITLPFFHAAQVALVAPAVEKLRTAEHISRQQLTFTAASDQPDLAGFHRKVVLVDQHKRRWVFKPAPKPDAKFRPEVEHEAHVLARLLGYQTAVSHLITHDGQYGQAQAMLPVTGSLLGTTGAKFADLSRRQLIAIAKEHLLDWLLDNDDTHADNIVLCADGSVIGIDKGRAWRYVGGWDGLSADKKANTNCKLIYTDLYAAIAAHHLDRAVVDAMYHAVIGQATRMQRLPDAVLGEILHRAQANRPHFKPSFYQKEIATAPTNAEELVAQITARKNNLVADMQLLWQRIYTAAGWERPETPAHNLGPNPQGHPIHAGLDNPDLHDLVPQTKSYGTPTFIAGEHIEEAHILLWREQHPHSGYAIRGQFKIRPGQVYEAVRKWCAEQIKTALAKTGQVQVPGEAAAYAAIIAAAKTVSFHHQVGDTEYNRAKMDQLNAYNHILTTVRDDARKGLTGGDPGGLCEAQIEMCNLYLGYIQAIYERLVAKLQISQEGDFPRYKWTPGPKTVTKPGYTVAKLPLTRAAANLRMTPEFDQDGELALSGDVLKSDANCTNGQLGQMYLTTLVTGEQIEFRGDADTDTPLTCQGTVQFTIPDAKDMPAALTRIRTQLTAMGCPLVPATRADLELFYWRHLAHILADRADSRRDAPPCNRRAADWARFVEFWKRADSNKPDEIARWRHAFAALTSPAQIATFVDSGGHLPRFQHLDLRAPHQPCGKPHWMRFDVTDADLRERPMLGANFRNGPELVLTAGAAMSTETRIRTLAIWKPGQSSAEDLNCGSGSFVFLRNGMERWNDPASIYFHPRVLARTTTYTFGGDFYGRLSSRRECGLFAFDRHAAHVECGNETMVKDAIGLLDDIELMVFKGAATRDAWVARLAKLGITEIRGLPVALRCITRSTGRAARDEVCGLIRATYDQGW